MNATPSLSLNPGVETNAEVLAARRPVPAPTSLKAERVQLSAESPRARLKAERVQEKLRVMPGWRLVSGGWAIDRLREFPDPRSAVAFAGFPADLQVANLRLIEEALAPGDPRAH